MYIYKYIYIYLYLYLYVCVCVLTPPRHLFLTTGAPASEFAALLAPLAAQRRAATIQPDATTPNSATGTGQAAGFTPSRRRPTCGLLAPVRMLYIYIYIYISG